MTLLAGPEYVTSVANTDGLWTDSVRIRASASYIILRVENFVYFANNGAWAARLYYEGSASPSGNGVHPGTPTLGGAQQGPFNNTIPVNVVWAASVIPAGQFAFGFVLPSTTMIQGMILSLWDDVGGFPGGLAYAGSYHDPMLDLILASVRKTY